MPISERPGLAAIREASSLARRAAATLAVVVACTSTGVSADEVLVAAAASLTNALTEIGKEFEERSEHEVKFSFSSSSIIARQIARGAPAEIYVSANIQWMDYLQENDEILADTRTPLLANQLALVAPRGSKIDRVEIRPGFPLAELLGDARLVMGHPAHVPAGIYGKQALKSLHVWSSVKDQVARSADVRAALALVALGETPLGIVYRTDAFAADGVKVVGTFPASSHQAIIYPATLTRAVGPDNAAAHDFYRFMDSGLADRILESYRFTVLD